MRKLGFVLVAMLAMTLVGAAYAAPGEFVGDPCDVEVNVSVAKWAALTTDLKNINLTIHQPEQEYGALATFTVNTNTPVAVSLESMTPSSDAENWKWPVLVDFSVRIPDDPWFVEGVELGENGEMTGDEFPAAMDWALCGQIFRGRFQDTPDNEIKGSANPLPVFPNPHTRKFSVLYTIEAQQCGTLEDGEIYMPAADEEFTITLVFQLCEADPGDPEDG
jgi:hypothetical protein